MKTTDLEWIEELPEVGNPILTDMRRVAEQIERAEKAMEQARAHYDSLFKEIAEDWSVAEIKAAQKAARINQQGFGEFRHDAKEFFAEA